MAPTTRARNEGEATDARHVDIVARYQKAILV